MSIEDYFRPLKRILLRSRQNVGNKALFDLANKALVELKIHRLLQRSAYQTHLHDLENPAGFDRKRLTIGYPLEKAARKLKPRIIGDDLSKPILAMVCTGENYARLVEIGTRTKSDYCRRHGYNMAIVEEQIYRYNRHAAWLKIPLVFRLMQIGYERIFYVDADSVITNPEVSAQEFFDRLEAAGRHLMLAEDICSLNTGVFFMRNTWQSCVLLDLIYEWEAGDGHWEQGALIGLIEQNPIVKSLLYLEPDSRRFHSMPFDRPLSLGLPSDCSPYAWQPGDFICHFAGPRNKQYLANKMKRILETAGPGQS